MSAASLVLDLHKAVLNRPLWRPVFVAIVADVLTILVQARSALSDALVAGHTHEAAENS